MPLNIVLPSLMLAALMYDAFALCMRTSARRTLADFRRDFPGLCAPSSVTYGHIDTFNPAPHACIERPPPSLAESAS